MVDIFTSQKRSEIMSKIKSKNSKAELVLRKALYSLGIRYRIHSSGIIGKPDIAIKKYKLAIFIDGDWWHGRNYDKEYKKYPIFWQEKILKNMERDQSVNDKLKKDGWTVLRFWQKNVEKRHGEVARAVSSELLKLRSM